MKKQGRLRNWVLWLPAAALLVSAVLLLLALAADRALRAENEAALEGRLLRLAHRIEIGLREQGMESRNRVLAEEQSRDDDVAAGVALAERGRGTNAEDLVCVGSCVGEPRLEVEILLGREWAGASPGSVAPGEQGRAGRGRRLLRLWTWPAAAALSWPEALLLPASGVAAALTVALALLGGVLLERQREQAERFAERRRLEGLARASAGLAHQLRTPLATIKGSCQLLAEGCAPEYRRRLDAVLEQSDRMERLVGQLLDYTRPPRPSPEQIQLPGFLGRVAELDARVAVVVDPGATVYADPDHLHQTLLNLVGNALEVTPEDGSVELCASELGDSVEIRVIDHGPGPGPDPEKWFEPWVTSRSDGIGLGLAIARALTEASGGRLSLRAARNGGCEAVLLFPRMAEVSEVARRVGDVP